MAIDYVTMYRARQQPQLGMRVAVALLQTARGILTEASTTTNHANRLQWAMHTFQDPDAMTAKMIWAFVSVPAVASGTATDTQLQNVSDTIVDLYPGL